MVQWRSRKWLYAMYHCGDSISSKFEKRVIAPSFIAGRLMGDQEKKVGLWFYGLGTAITGILDIAWRAFDPSHQPIKAFGNFPNENILACTAGVWLVAAGVAIPWQRSRRMGAAACGVAYSVFAAWWLARYYAGTHALGWRIDILLGVCFGIGQQLILISPAVIVYACIASTSSVSRLQERAVTTARWMLGLPPIVFGLMHLAGLRFFATIVPHWIPFGSFWAGLTGLAFILAGLAICSGVRDALAARLLALMLLLFEGSVEVPPIFVRLHDQATWGAAAYNLPAIGACLIFASLAASRVIEPNAYRLERCRLPIAAK
jgi:uncharacterized membrane protein